MKTTLHFIIAAAAAALSLFCAVLAYQNAAPVQLSFFLAKSISLPLGFVLVSAIAISLICVPILIPVVRQITNQPMISQSGRRPKTKA